MFTQKPFSLDRDRLQKIYYTVNILCCKNNGWYKEQLQRKQITPKNLFKLYYGDKNVLTIPMDRLSRDPLIPLSTRAEHYHKTEYNRRSHKVKRQMFYKIKRGNYEA